MTFRTLDDAKYLAGKTALVRVDFNVPMEGGKVTDDTRLRVALPTIQRLRDAGAKVALLAHFDRPKGQRVPSMSLKPVVQPLEELLGAPVRFADDCIGGPAVEAIRDLDAGGVVLLENVRFHAAEEANDPVFAQKLADLGDLYVNDAFSAAHRAHASTEGIAHHIPAYAGESMRRELDALDAALGNPQKPVVGIVGGSKVSTKLDLLKNLVGKLDALAIGGGMANTFLYAQGVDIGGSLAEKDMADTAREILAGAEAKGCDILLPVDVVVATEVKPGADARTVKTGRSPVRRRQDSGRRPRDCRPPERRRRRLENPDLERPAGRVRGSALRRRHGRRRPARRRTHQGRRPDRGGGRRRHGCGRRPRRRRGGPDLRLHGRRRLPGMDGGQAPARRRGAARLMGLAMQTDHACTLPPEMPARRL